ncbi:FAD synthase [Candidatus Parcubacteria bacterium]|nr:MAG: FAD synthase [Candidatus Parcubacteria bacterium]
MKKVMVFGTFDIVHMGHIHMFKQAREYGDHLIVVVGRDCNVERIKGIGSLHSEEERLKFLKHIDVIDLVCLGDKENPYKIIEKHRPDIIALGYDQKEYVDKLSDFLTQVNLESEIVRLTPYQEHKFKSGKIRKYIERIV